eukprot:scaffold49383_cov27-Tisochrysis_lutea.AAC.10
MVDIFSRSAEKTRPICCAAAAKTPVSSLSNSSKKPQQPDWASPLKMLPIDWHVICDEQLSSTTCLPSSRPNSFTVSVLPVAPGPKGLGERDVAACREGRDAKPLPDAEIPVTVVEMRIHDGDARNLAPSVPIAARLQLPAKVGRTAHAAGHEVRDNVALVHSEGDHALKLASSPRLSQMRGIVPVQVDHFAHAGCVLLLALVKRG